MGGVRNYINNSSNSTSKNTSYSARLWVILSIVIGLTVSFWMSFTDASSFGIFLKLLMIGLLATFGPAGAYMGDALRKFAHPDGIFMSGGMSELIVQKIFWRYIPQLVGYAIGVTCAFTILFLSLAVPSKFDHESANVNNQVTSNAVSERIEQAQVTKTDNKTVEPTVNSNLAQFKSVTEQEQEEQYTGDDPIVRARLGLPQKN